MKKLIFTAVFMLAAMLQTTAQGVVLQNSVRDNEPDISANDDVSKALRIDLPSNLQKQDYVRPTADQRFKRYMNKMVGTGLIGVGISSTINIIFENPPEWEKSGKGFARHLGSNFGENAIEKTIAFGIEESFKLDSKFYKSKKRDLGSRIKNGLLSGITARTPSGKRVFNPAPIIGAYSANLVSTQVWYPNRFSYKDGFRQGTQSVGFSIGFGLINEFFFNRK